jgi:hypothetical protein
VCIPANRSRVELYAAETLGVCVPALLICVQLRHGWEVGWMSERRGEDGSMGVGERLGVWEG